MKQEKVETSTNTENVLIPPDPPFKHPKGNFITHNPYKSNIEIVEDVYVKTYKDINNSLKQNQEKEKLKMYDLYMKKKDSEDFKDFKLFTEYYSSQKEYKSIKVI